jgi:opacity protein-like surface antigen
VRIRSLIALSFPCLLLAQERSEALEHQMARQEARQGGADLRSSFLFGVAQAANSQTRQDLASSGVGAAVAWELEWGLHNHWVVGSHLGGVWLRERSFDFSPFPGSVVSSQMNGFQAGAEAKYFLTDAEAKTGPYLVAVGQWTRWKKYLSLDFQGYRIDDGQSRDQIRFSPSVGMGWHLNRIVALDLRYTYSRFHETYTYYQNYSKDWNLDHLTFSLVLRAGAK